MIWNLKWDKFHGHKQTLKLKIKCCLILPEYTIFWRKIKLANPPIVCCNSDCTSFFTKQNIVTKPIDQTNALIIKYLEVEKVVNKPQFLFNISY